MDVVMGDGRRLSEEEVRKRAGAQHGGQEWRALLAARAPRPCALCGEPTTAGVLLPAPGPAGSAGELVAYPICKRCGILVRAVLGLGDDG